LKPGTILRLFLNIVNPPKIKWFVVLSEISTSDSLLMTIINTEVNRKVNPTEELETLHLPLRKAEYPTLDHDCNLDCARAYELPLTQTAFDAVSGKETVKGTLSNHHLELAIKMLKSSPIIEKKLLKKYGLL